MKLAGYVFGFGSLVDVPALAKFLGREEFGHGEIRLCELHHHRRTWNIARDNRQVYEDRPYYIDPDTGERANLFVTVVNIRRCSGHAVNGILFPVTSQEIALLDHRELNYDRCEVSDLVSVSSEHPVWVYRGSAAAEKRFEVGKAEGLAVVNADYHARVTEAFASHGPDFEHQYRLSTDPPTVPLRPLALRAPG